VRAQGFAETCVTTTSTSTSTSTTTTRPTDLLSARSLILAEGRGRRAGRVRLRLVSRDPAVGAGDGPGGADDPRRHGGGVHLRSAPWGLDVTHELPAPGWRAKGRGWRYGDDGGTTVVLRPGRVLRLTLKRADLVLGATDPTPLGVVLELGARRLCFEFGSGTAVRTRRRLVARDGAAPAACAVP
jgi:hypothetical protein